MKDLIIKLFVVTLILFTGDRLIGFYLDSLYAKNYMHYSNGHLNYYLKNKECDTLLLGSSRIMSNLDPTHFGPSTFNIGQPAKHIGWCAAVLDLMEQENKLPKKLLVINIEPDDFNPFHDAKLNSDIHFLKYYYNSNQFIRREINKASPFEFLKYMSSAFRHNGDGLILLTNPIQKIGFLPANNGFVPIESSAQDSARVFATIEEPANKDPLNFKHSQGAFYLEHILQICHRHKIKLVVLTAPLFKPSKYAHHASINLRSYLEKNQIPYLNYLSDTPKDLKDLKYWYDNIHFNHIGADLFSKRVHADLKKHR